LTDGKVRYCHECSDFPCANLLKLDKKYRENYRMSMVENLEYIREHGMPMFLDQEAEKWRCLECGGVICCHNGICYSCGVDRLRNKEKPYRWEE